MNKILLEEGYYMAEFEVKMMGIVYYLDKGHYRKAFSTLSRFHSQLKNRILQEKKELYIIGFDLLQISRYSTVYLYSPE